MRPALFRLICCFVRLLLFFITVRFQVRMIPKVNAPAGVFFDRRFEPGLRFQFDRTDHRYVYSQTFIENDHALRNKIMLSPELVRGEGSMNIPDHVILEHVAWPQTRNCDVLLSEVCINRRFTSDWS